METPLWMRKGEFAEVRSFDEIVSTLDEQGKMDGLAFMPEMTRLCGRRFRVHARADRTCVEHIGKRGLENTVWLEGVRCDGSEHACCDIGCLMFCKEAWLKRVDAAPAATAPDPVAPVFTWRFSIKDETTGKYTCQSTSLEGATRHLGLWGNCLTHLRDLYYGNMNLARLGKVLFIYASLKLRVDVNGRNRSMLFTLDLLDLGSGRYEVERRIERCIDEGTCQMRSVKNSVLLKGVTCFGTYRRPLAQDPRRLRHRSRASTAVGLGLRRSQQPRHPLVHLVNSPEVLSSLATPITIAAWRQKREVRCDSDQ
jgi:hypothetical protein